MSDSGQCIPPNYKHSASELINNEFNHESGDPDFWEPRDKRTPENNAIAWRKWSVYCRLKTLHREGIITSKRFHSVVDMLWSKDLSNTTLAESIVETLTETLK